MNPNNLTSIKPHLLRGWLGWCAANKLTPLLVVEALPYVGLPATVLAAASQKPGHPLVFSLSNQVAAKVGFTSQSIHFTTLFPGHRQISTVEIPTTGWRALRVAETNWRVDLSFDERLDGTRRPDAMPWPTGTGGLVLPMNETTTTKHEREDNTSARQEEIHPEEPRKPSLVWKNPVAK